MQRSS